ncbi:GBF-interacting protein 1-like isoform X2 [Glycine soja]|uniref:GBF-interacting protein 1 isoform B n=1 Tax=Glycine soja TaxID=3848 RepID=A0A445JRU8_GLYSO|nr:GBF-interacting protein 1-like isoform X2 [Glycine max]XP_028239164.1 GBF-interacting protein 1-like isoform X2 [Glycine soja]RZC01220.1 GBF-interacting protein 1 isoform B [Glycine soja]|eukprot:XP_006583148.1 GBF-interacting protein 1-like isoform X2 [Glycine max]
MVPGSRTEGGTGTHLLSARVRKTIQSIKEIVGNHSDADIYVALKETNMDPNETTQKLLNQDPFHEVKRRRDRKKETQNVGNKGQPSADSRRSSENNSGQGMKFNAPSERNVRRTNYSRNTLPGISKEFRVVRDNRVNHIYKEVKPLTQQHSTSATEQLNVNTPDKGSSGSRNSSLASNGPSDSHARYLKDAVPNIIDRKIASEDKDKQGMISNAAGRVQPIKPNNAHQNSASVASTSSAVGVYSSSTDPVHVPSPDSRSSGVVGAIRREVGVVGVRRQSSDNKAKQSFAPSISYVVGKDGTSADSFQSVGAVSKTEQFSQTNVTEPSLSGMPVSRPSLNNQYNNRPHQQLVGHQRVSQQNKEWKPKSSQKPNSNSPGVIGTPKKAAVAAASPPAENSGDIESNTTELQDKLSQVNIYENQNVIIAQHIRVPETDRCQLTFGTIGTELDSSRLQSKYHIIGASEKSNEELTASLTVPAPELSTDDVSGSKQVDLRDEHIRSSRSDSPVSGAASEQQLPDNKDSSNTQNLDNYANIGLVRDSSPSYAPSEPQQQDSHDMPGFAAYDPPAGYDIPYFRPTIDETVRGQGLSSPQEALISHATNNPPASTIAMVQQQQPPVPQMYPQVHVSHFANLMPYRQFLSPVYVPPMAMPGYSSNPPYPHPTNGSSYLLMPGGGSHLNANNLKYGVQQFKPVPAGSPTGFGNFANPTGYAMITPGVVGGATALEDSSRVKYKDNLYVPNPQAETSEIWLQNPRDLPGMQSTPYYNMPGQTPHAAYMPSHTGHASFNAAAAQSSHMQFPGMYHTPPQPAAMASPHHLGPPAIGNNVGVGVAAAAPGAQVGAYQQPQLGHINWTTNF